MLKFVLGRVEVGFTHAEVCFVCFGVRTDALQYSCTGFVVLDRRTDALQYSCTGFLFCHYSILFYVSNFHVTASQTSENLLSG